MAKLKKTQDWQKKSENTLGRVLLQVMKEPALKRRSGARARDAAMVASVRLVGNSVMKELNSYYRGKDVPTDVLSFEAPPVFRSQGVIGELVICLPLVKRQAKQNTLAVEDELRVLVVHGVLHLLGFDHEMGPAEAKKMSQWEAKLLPARLRRVGLIGRG